MDRHSSGQAGRIVKRCVIWGLIAACAITGVLAGAGGVPNPGAGQGKGRGNGPAADRFGSEVAIAWFARAIESVKAERFSPVVASRVYGCLGVALYEAVVPGMPGHRSLAGQINELDSVPAIEAHKKYHWPTVANAALASMMRSLFAGKSAPTLAAIDLLEQQLADNYDNQVPPPVFARSVEHGRAVAVAVIAWTDTDGFSAYNNCAYAVPAGPGLWVPTPPAFAAAPLQPCWGSLRTFVLSGPNECPAAAMTPYSEDPASVFFAEAKEVYDVSRALTDEQRAIALFWADNPGVTGTPPGHWISITGQVLAEDRRSLDVAAEAYARVGMAVADGFIACWYTKYVANLLRPVTYIRAQIDSAYSSPIPTPAFPEYTSGHSVQSGAAATVLTDLFGARPFTDHTHDGIGLAPRSFASFEAAAAEAAVSRLYGGIHYRPAIVNGIAQGRCVGQVILDNVEFQTDGQ